MLHCKVLRHPKKIGGLPSHQQAALLAAIDTTLRGTGTIYPAKSPANRSVLHCCTISQESSAVDASWSRTVKAVDEPLKQLTFASRFVVRTKSDSR